MIRTERLVNGQICQLDGSESQSCWNSINQGFNFTETALREDFEAMDRAYKQGGASKRKIRRLTKTFPYCQKWRKSVGLETSYKIRIN